MDLLTIITILLCISAIFSYLNERFIIARLISVSFPAVFLLHEVNFRNLSILTWAGVRGGISVAMALSLPDSPYREIILSSCYFIVIFSIIIQGLTLNRLVTKLSRDYTLDKKTKAL